MPSRNEKNERMKITIKNNTRQTTRKKILAYADSQIEKTGYLPSLREIAAAVGLASPSAVKRHLDILAEEGLLCTGKTNIQTTSSAFTVPVMREREIIENLKPVGTEVVFLSGKTAGNDLFATTVKDNALSGIGIFEGDLVIADRNFDLKSGDIGIFIAEKQMYIRVFHAHADHFLLEARNEEFENIHCQEFFCRGKITALQRIYKKTSDIPAFLGSKTDLS